MISYSTVFVFMLVISRAVHLQWVSAFITVYHLANVIQCRIESCYCESHHLLLFSCLVFSPLHHLSLLPLLRQDVSLFITVYRLVDFIDCRMRFLWYVMRPLMISYSMIFDVHVCHRSCCSSSGCKSIHHCSSSWWCHWVSNSKVFLWYFMSPPSPVMFSCSIIFSFLPVIARTVHLHSR